jgi:dephospho-CoA kinase
MEYPELPVINWTGKIFVIGLTGGIGSGKSSAADFFRKEGIAVLDADHVAKTVLHSDRMRPKLIEALGPDILDEQGLISREKIAGVVFHNDDLRKRLNGLIHPEVHRKFLEFRDSLNPGDIMVYDIPLLFEVGQSGRFNMTLVISASYETRKQRAIARDGWTEEHFTARDSSQMPLEEKETMADLVIRNNRSLDDLGQSIHSLILHIKAGRRME